MAYLDTSPAKLSFLLEHGTHEGELKKFFTESRTSLLMKGAKVQNIPHGREERIRAICNRLTRKTDSVLQAWFSKNVTLAVPAPLEDVTFYLGEHFGRVSELPKSESALICRSALMYLFQLDPGPEIIGLLNIDRAGIEPADAGQEGGSGGAALLGDAVPSSSLVPDGSIRQDSEISELVASLISHDDKMLEAALEPFGQKTRSLVDALLLLRAGELESATQQLPLLGDSGPQREVFDQAFVRARHQRGSNEDGVGIRVLIPVGLTDEIEGEEYEIIGVYTNASEAGAVFVQPIMIFSEGRLLRLSKEQCIDIFPESGSVMTHRPALRRNLRNRDLVRWKVSERGRAEGRTRFHMDVEYASPIRIVSISVPSRDPDEVRERIKTHASAAGGGGDQVIFVLLDGLAVLSPKGSDLTRDEAFSSPWQAWTSLETWLIEGSQYCLDLPAGHCSSLDLSPIGLAFSKILKNLGAQGRLATTKAQRKELVELIEKSDGREVSERARRIAATVHQISIDEEQLESVLGLLGAHADVKRRVDEIIRIGVEERQRERSGLTEDIGGLQRRKERLEKEGREIESKNRLRAESMGSAVKQAFDSAISEGATSLASAEIFRILTNQISPSGQPGLKSAKDVRSWTSSDALSTAMVKDRLLTLGVNSRQATVLCALTDVARRAGVALIIRGSIARQCVQALSCHDRSEVVFMDVPMGLISSGVLHQHLAANADTNALVLLGADLSPMDVYATWLFDLTMGQFLEEREARVLVIGSCVGGELSLSVPPAWRRISMVVDLDSKWDEVLSEVDEDDDSRCLLLPKLRDSVATGISEVEEGLRIHLSSVVARATCAL